MRKSDRLVHQLDENRQGMQTLQTNTQGNMRCSGVIRNLRWWETGGSEDPALLVFPSLPYARGPIGVMRTQAEKHTSTRVRAHTHTSDLPLPPNEPLIDEVTG